VAFIEYVENLPFLRFRVPARCGVGHDIVGTALGTYGICSMLEALFMITPPGRCVVGDLGCPPLAAERCKKTAPIPGWNQESAR
jgi:hypothetical protein